MRSPLWRIRSLKTKLSIVIVAAVGVTALSSIIGFRLGWPIWVRPIVASAVALVMVQFLARGMTRPLRVIDAAARRLSSGDYEARATQTTADEIGRLAGTFNMMAAELDAAEAHRRRFIADAAHELRTPVAGLLATTENMLDGIVVPDHEQLASLHAQCQRLSTITRDLLDLSRLESHAEHLNTELVDLNDVAAAAAQGLRQRHPDAELRVERGRNTEVEVDAEHVQRAIANLLENAAIHGRHPNDVAIITMSVQRHGGRVQLSVADRGPGLGPDPSQAFERFHRRAAHDRPGTGLGLAITREIVLHHGGTIDVRNTPVGACVVVTLPAAA